MGSTPRFTELSADGEACDRDASPPRLADTALHDEQRRMKALLRDARAALVLAAAINPCFVGNATTVVREPEPGLRDTG